MARVNGRWPGQLNRYVSFIQMITKSAARALALAKILEMWSIDGDVPVILDEYTIERDFGWVFFYDSQKHQRTNQFSHALAGNAPIIVNRFDSSLHFTGTALAIEEYICRYEGTFGNAQGHGAVPDGET
jgi:hypothetical protein